MINLFKNINKRDWILIFIMLILIYLQVWLDLKMPDYMSKITVLVQTEGSKMSEILTNGGYMLTCALFSMIFAIIVGYMVSIISSNLSKNVFISKSLSFFNSALTENM